LLNSAYSAPYFHDGSLATLGDVVDWFNDNFHLGFTNVERADLTEYLVAVGSADIPYEEFDDENTEFLLHWTELTTFCTTLESKLIPQRDAHHAILLLDTVVPDFREDAGELKDKNYAALVYRVAGKLDEIKIAIQAGDWTQAAALYGEYEELVYQYGPKLK
jgi:hypothetical protein